MNSTGQNTESSSTTTCVQAAADSVADASNKGQAQSSTPPEWGRVLSRPLNPFRPVITDLTCGNGNLLHAASNGDAILLGCDIQNEEAGSQISEHLVIADLTAFYPLLQSVDWQGDCFVLNPPWDLHWYRERLEGLARSGRETVRLAWRATDARLGADTLDSTLATLMIALDRMSAYGEGLLIANEATLQRLLFNGPHGALAQHVWAHLVVEGNLCSGTAKSKFREGFQTGIIWFAAGHDDGVAAKAQSRVTTLDGALEFCEYLRSDRFCLRDGQSATEFRRTAESAALWGAAKQRMTGDRFGPGNLSAIPTNTCYTLILGPGNVQYVDLEVFLSADLESVISLLRSLFATPGIEVPQVRITARDFACRGGWLGLAPGNPTELDLVQIDSMTQTLGWEARLRTQYELGRFCLTKLLPSSAYCCFHQALQLFEINCEECLKAWVREAFGNNDVFRSYLNSPDHLVVNGFVFTKTPFVRKMLSAYENVAAEKGAQMELERLRRSRFKCYIYLMEDLRNGTFKIGRSKTPAKRERTLQSEVPQIVMRFSVPGEEAHEKQLHDHFQGKRLRGEWFTLTNDDLLWIVDFLKVSGDSARAIVDYQWLGAVHFTASPTPRNLRV